MKHTSIIIDKCRKLFLIKLIDYDFSWKKLRYFSIIDQIFIKIMRIKNIQLNKNQLIKEETIIDTYIDIINYFFIILIKIDLDIASKSISHKSVLSIYNKNIEMINNYIVKNNNMLKNTVCTADDILKKIFFKKNEEEIPLDKLKEFSIEIVMKIFFLLEKNF
ncbi:nucleotide modification associated domain-containing protein [Blattabacterium cuenoti]|uniref:nucleotide modification associated domain-containing protein n=1 Tax=Blattabacterium cuenoti TaxID=1653831 RepID=UPI00163BEB05|nr:nucleotide modification associated domain-containing protein [Blattabacterium cuenoti]